MIVTLAGHVDHGKTSLVRAVTGVDTDRLAEEKRRGLTIDLGFAYLDAPGTTLGFVDVPGHHRFIHNMVAGVASRQFALLVIAADDGPMPQSREHLQILELLGVSRGVIALSKADRVDAARLAAAREEIRALTANTFLADAEIVATSAETGEGIDTLRDHLLAAAAREESAPESAEFRLAIDRAFTVTGAGVVVTGTVHSGAVTVDDPLHIFPTAQSVRVRSVRAQNRETSRASAGDRCALNLAGVEVGDVSRGQWLTDKPVDGSREMLLSLKVLDDFPRDVRHWLPVHVYQASAHSTGHVALLQEARLKPGSVTAVELITDEPLLVRRGDRLVLRDQGLDRTLGGGEVLTPRPASGRRRAPERLQRLAADQAVSAEEALARHLEIGEVHVASFAETWRLDEAALQSLLEDFGCLTVGDTALERSRWDRYLHDVAKAITDRHEADTSLQGLKLSDLAVEGSQALLEAALAELVKQGQLEVKTGRYLPAEHQVELSAPEQELLDRITGHLDQPQPPSLGDLAKLLRQPIAQLSKGLVPLVAKKRVVKVSDSRYYLPKHVAALAELALQLGSKGPFTVRQYRDAAGIGRNVAIEMLEFFDRRGFTRRSDNERAISGDLSLLP